MTVLALIFWISLSAWQQDKVEAITQPNQQWETMKTLFLEKVSQKVKIEQNYLHFILADAAKMVKEKNWTRSQYFVYVDRNPIRQIVFIFFFDLFSKNIELIGVDKVSTGNPKRKGHFLTPTGIFENTVKNFGYRALGTRNDKGWKGLGEKGSRVWDFGWQKTEYKKKKREIRLLLHATDPVYGEKRLGKIDSKGCVRISAKLNKFLDQYGILDEDYYKSHLNAVRWLLKLDQPVAFAGKYLLIGDSSNFK